MVASARAGRSSRFKSTDPPLHTHSMGAAHAAAESDEGDIHDDSSLDAYGKAVVAGMSEPPPPSAAVQQAAPPAYGADEASVQAQADLLFQARMEAMQAEEGSTSDDEAGMPPSLLGLSTVLSEMQGADYMSALPAAWPVDLPPVDAKQAPAQQLEREHGGIALCAAMLPQLSTFASAISAATSHATSHSYGSALAGTAQLTIESSLTLRRRLVRQLVQPLDSSSLAGRVFLSQCVLAAAAIPGQALQQHGDALTSPGKPSAPTAGQIADPVRDAAALAARHLFVCSKSSSLDAVFRESGCLGVILEVLRMGCDAPETAWGSAASNPSTPQKRSTLPRVEAGAGAVTGRAAPELPAAFHFPACPAQGNELTYLLGVLKNVSHTEENASWLVTQGALSVLVSILEGVTAASVQGGEGGGFAAASCGTSSDAKHMGQVAVQATGVLRNLCLLKRHLPQVWSSGAVDSLLRVLPRLRRHSEVGLNAARILAKLTLHEPARARFVAVPAYVASLLELVSLAPHRAPAALVIRVMFSLGNLTATNEATRQRLGRHPDAVPAIGTLLTNHTKLLVANLPRSAQAAGQGGTPSGGTGSDAKLPKPAAEAADVLVKTCRTAAHLAMDPSIAAGMLQASGVGTALGALLEALPSPLPQSLVELALNTLAVCTNLAFHPAPPSDGADGQQGCLASHCDTIAPSLVKLMQDPHDDVVVHAVRTAANLCRRPGTRNALAAAASGGIVSAAVTLLHHRKREAALTACGLLMNIVLTPAGRQALAFTCLVEEGGEGGHPMSAIAVLSRVVEAAYWGGDVEFSSTAARVLFNHCLGWGDDDGGEPPRMTDDEALGLLAVADGVFADAQQQTGAESEGKQGGQEEQGESGEGVAALNACADVVGRLREEVKRLVDAGRVADHEERFHATDSGGKQ